MDQWQFVVLLYYISSIRHSLLILLIKLMLGLYNYRKKQILCCILWLAPSKKERCFFNRIPLMCLEDTGGIFFQMLHLKRFALEDFETLCICVSSAMDIIRGK